MSDVKRNPLAALIGFGIAIFLQVIIMASYLNAMLVSSSDDAHTAVVIQIFDQTLIDMLQISVLWWMGFAVVILLMKRAPMTGLGLCVILAFIPIVLEPLLPGWAPIAMMLLAGIGGVLCAGLFFIMLRAEIRDSDSPEPIHATSGVSHGAG